MIFDHTVLLIDLAIVVALIPVGLLRAYVIDEPYWETAWPYLTAGLGLYGVNTALMVGTIR